MAHSQEPAVVDLGEDQHPEKSDNDEALRASEKPSLSFIQIYKVSRHKAIVLPTPTNHNE